MFDSNIRDWGEIIRFYETKQFVCENSVEISLKQVNFFKKIDAIRKLDVSVFYTVYLATPNSWTELT